MQGKLERAVETFLEFLSKDFDHYRFVSNLAADEGRAEESREYLLMARGLELAMKHAKRLEEALKEEARA